jgi:hypothetical protein
LVQSSCRLFRRIARFLDAMAGVVVETCRNVVMF